ncbi:M20/M25/M40 family metallo-hydrolase [Granulicella tundricola]|uniref:M20/M25/M40 family metallo-hydrolase n=1 Tax=Granulicella tundricola TaxID=940615 RepID=UPI001E4C46C5|nr:M20/M25/M40 family metallo-hydrolase [Granulicella tundricola]
MAQRGGVGLPGVSGPVTAQYQADATRILAAAATDTDGYAALTYLCDRIGNRNSGTPQLNAAVQWGAELMKKAGLQNVTIQPAMVPHWVRGKESASIVSPGLNGVPRKLRMLGLGMSVGTPAGGITAEVLFLHDYAELDALPADGAKGKIVVFDPGWHGYGVGTSYRTNGASRAAAKGAVAVLVRSATGLALQAPHTGRLVYDEKAPKIPSAAISVEDAGLIGRLAKDGPVTVHLEMEAHQEADVKSGNVYGDLVGSEHPEDVVVLGGHIDSWDVGQGAQDDGGGIMATFEAVSLLHKLGLKPKRTIRVVFWVNEENGGRGGDAYPVLLGAAAVAKHVAAIEMDGGAEKPLGMGYGTFGMRMGPPKPGAPPQSMTPPGFDLTKLTEPQQASFALLQQIAALLGPIGADKVFPGGGGEDIGPIVAMGVPSLSPHTVGEHYFDWHHSEADTLDKVDLEDFRKNIGMLAVTSFVLADTKETLVGEKLAKE